MEFKELITKEDIEGILEDHKTKELIQARVKPEDVGQKASELEKKFDKNQPKKRKLKKGAAVLGIAALLFFGGGFYKPVLAIIHNEKGVRLHCYKKSYQKAEVEYRKSIELYPHISNVHNNLGLLYYEQKIYKEAEAKYKKALEVDPKNAAVYFNLGLLYKVLKQYEKAEESLKKSIELDPDYAPVYRNLGGLYRMIGRNDKAEIQFRIAEEMENPRLKK